MTDKTLEQTAPADLATTSAAPPAPRYNPDAPSEEWGWHGSWRSFAPRGSRILLWAGLLLIILSIFSVHVSRVEDYWVGTIAFFGLLWLISREVSGRRMRRRSERSDS